MAGDESPLWEMKLEMTFCFCLPLSLSHDDYLYYKNNTNLLLKSTLMLKQSTFYLCIFHNFSSSSNPGFSHPANSSVDSSPPLVLTDFSDSSSSETIQSWAMSILVAAPKPWHLSATSTTSSWSIVSPLHLTSYSWAEASSLLPLHLTNRITKVFLFLLWST